MVPKFFHCTPGMGGVNLMIGGVKFLIFKFAYNAQFWSYEQVTNMFWVCFELKKHLRTFSEHSEQNLRFLTDLKLLHGVKQGFSRNFHIFQVW